MRKRAKRARSHQSKELSPEPLFHGPHRARAAYGDPGGAQCPECCGFLKLPHIQHEWKIKKHGIFDSDPVTIAFKTDRPNPSLRATGPLLCLRRIQRARAQGQGIHWCRTSPQDAHHKLREVAHGCYCRESVAVAAHSFRLMIPIGMNLNLSKCCARRDASLR